MRAATSQLSLDYEGVNSYWRPLVVMAQLFDRSPYRPKRRSVIAAKQCKKRSGKLQGVQLGLFEDFYRPPAPARVIADPERPLADVFPEAYLDTP
jgi:hypothetical protein